MYIENTIRGYYLHEIIRSGESSWDNCPLYTIEYHASRGGHERSRKGRKGANERGRGGQGAAGIPEGCQYDTPFLSDSVKTHDFLDLSSRNVMKL